LRAAAKSDTVFRMSSYLSAATSLRTHASGSALALAGLLLLRPARR